MSQASNFILPITTDTSSISLPTKKKYDHFINLLKGL